MSINDIINNKNNRDMVSAFKKMADGKPVNLSIQPSSVNMPDEMRVKVLNPTEEVTVKNLGDVLKSLGLLGVGLSELKDSLESLDLEKEINIEAGEINLGPVTKAIESLKSEIKSLPARTIAATPDIKFPKLEIPKEFKVKEIGDLKKGLVSINDNLVKLAGVVRESQPEINIPESDATDLISAVSSVEKAVKGIIFPLPPATTPAYKNTNQEAASAVLQADGSVPVTIIGGAGSGGTSAADDADFTPGSTAGTPAMGIYESSPTSVTDGDLGVAGITATRELKVSIEADNVGIGGGTQYTEDAVAAADPVGNASILVREDSPVSIAADGDNVALRGTQYGAAYSQIVDSSGNFVDSFGGGTQYAVDTALGATPTGTLSIGIRDDALSSLTPVEGDAVGLRVDANGALWVIPSGTVTVDGSGVTQPVSGTVTANLSATDNAVLDSIDAAVNGTLTVGSHAVTNAGTFAVQISDTSFAVADGNALGEGVLIQGDDGTDRKNINVDATTGDVQVDVTNTVTVDGSGVTQPVSGTVTANLGATDNAVLDSIDAAVNGTLTVGSHAVTNAGTFAVQVDGAALTALQLIDDPIATDDTSTHTAATTKVMGIGAVAAPTDTNVDANDIAMPAMSTDRRLHTDSQIVGQDAALDVSAATVTVDNGGTFATQVDGAALTALQLIDDSIFADDTAFTLASSKVTMSGAIRDDSLTTLTAVEGDAVPLRVNSTGALHVTGAGGGTQYNIDTALGATDTTTLAGVVRDDSLSTLTEADGDVTVLRVSSTGALHVTGGGGGTEYNEDVATPATITGTATLMERDDALTTVTPIEGDWIGFRGTAEGALWVQDFNSDAILTDTNTIAGAVSGTEMQVDVVAALPAGDNNIGNVDIASSVALDVSAATVTVDLGANNDVTIDGSSIVHAEDTAHSTGNAGIMPLAVRNDTLAALAGTDGDYAPLQVNATGALFIDVADGGVLETAVDGIEGLLTTIDSDTSTIAGAVSGTEMQVDVITLPASTNTLEVVGDVAHDAAIAGNPVAIAGRATNNIEGLTQVANADSTYLTTDLNGVAVTRPHTTLEEVLSERVSDTGGTSTAFSTFGAGGAGVHNYVTTIVAHNSSGTDGYLDIRDGTGGSVLMTIPLPTTGGAVINLPVPLKGSANTALAYDVSAALSTVYISLVGYQAQG